MKHFPVARTGWSGPVTAVLGFALCSLWTATASATGSCNTYDSGTQVGTVTSEDLSELSGLAASHVNPGIFWTNNDSGSFSEVHAIDETGALHATYDVDNSTAIDWEDIAVGPCPDGCACLFIADMGDNLHIRTTKTIYRVREPALDEGLTSTDDAEELTFQYPDELHDAETLLVDPRTGIIYVVTKIDTGASSVYRFPSADPTDFPVTLEKVADIQLSGSNKLATGGSVTADGGRFVIRTLDHAEEYTIPEGAPLEDAFLSSPRIIPLPSTVQGEAISYTTDGMSLMTVTEVIPAPIFDVACLDGVPVTDPVDSLDAYCPPSSGCSAVAPISGLVPRHGAVGGVGVSLLGLALMRLRRRLSR